jgi:hypothetical protein
MVLDAVSHLIDLKSAIMPMPASAAAASASVRIAAINLAYTGRYADAAPR